MSKLQTAVYFFLAYFVCSFLLCGDMLSTLANAPIMARAGSRDFWNVFFLGSFALALIVSLPWLTPFIWPEFRPALFMTIWMLASATSAGIYGTAKLNEAIASLHPDKVFKNSFFQSLHQVPREFSTYAHAGAMKDCRPYYWSYTWLKFIPLNTDSAVNVLPQDWLDECNIKRAH